MTILLDLRPLLPPPTFIDVTTQPEPLQEPLPLAPQKPLRTHTPPTSPVELVRALIETLGGARPPAQLSRWCSEPVLHVLVAAARTRASRRLDLCSVRAQAVAPDADEVCVRVADSDGKQHALALRLERQRDRWICVALEHAPGLIAASRDDRGKS